MEKLELSNRNRDEPTRSPPEPLFQFPVDAVKKSKVKKISPSFRDQENSSMSPVTCLPVASSVLHFTGFPPAGTPLGTVREVPAGLLLFIPCSLQGLGRGGQSRHTTPSERTNARARPSPVSSAPFSEQRPRFGSTERARSLTKTPARRQISDPRFPVGGEKKQVAISRAGRTRRRRAA